MDISIIILNYQSKGFTLNCIKSIYEADWSFVDENNRERKIYHEIIVVDNNSNDSLGDILNWQYPEVKFIQNKKNLGMGAGNNIGIKQAAGDFVVIMNPDTIAFKDTFIRLYHYLAKNKDVGVVGPKQLNPDKSIQTSCYNWYSLFTPIYRRTPLGKLKFAQKDINRFIMTDFDRTSEADVNWLLGSFLFCRHSALKQIGLFDERFFMYFEDTDLCRRFWKNKWRVVFYPNSVIIHNHNRKSAEVAWYKALNNKAARAHIFSWIKFMKKWGVN